MKKFRACLVLSFSALTLFFAGCADELDTQPKVELSLDNLLAKDPNAIEGILSKMYGTFALTGPDGRDSQDIAGASAGETGFLRGILNLEDFTADDMKNRWGDDGLDQLTTTSSWDSNNKFFRYLYDRVYFIVPQTTNIILALNNVDVQDEDLIRSSTLR